MRIHIIGNSGSGKSYLAEQLSLITSSPHYDLDDVYWDNTAEQYGTKHTANERDASFSNILQHDAWIIEGIYDAWIYNSFQQADMILLLLPSLRTCKYRVICRFLKRKLGILHDKKESIASLFTLLTWMDQYDKINLPRIQNHLESYTSKVVKLHNQQEINHIIHVLKAKAE